MMDAEVQAEYDAIKSAAQTVVDFYNEKLEDEHWRAIEFVRSGGRWYCQMFTHTGPRTFSDEALIEVAADIRNGVYNPSNTTHDDSSTTTEGLATEEQP